jgi:hypothetical protein
MPKTVADPTIITLSSIPPRFAHLGPTLDSLLAQDLPAAQIILYVPERYRRFPDWDGTLPTDLPAGITLRRTPNDDGPATKILPALRDFAGQPVDLLFCDDDMLYQPGLNRRFKAARAAHPRAALCAVAHQLPGSAYRCQPRMQRWTAADLAQHLASQPPGDGPTPLLRTSGHADVAEGWGAVMVRPDYFDHRVFDIPCDLWMVDDPWLSGHLALRGVPIWAGADLPHPRRRPQVQRDIAPLFYEVIDDKTRSESDAACAAYYRKLGVWRTEPPPVSPLRRLARRLLPHALRAAMIALAHRISAR